MDQPLPWLSWALAGAAVVIIGIAKSGFGGGVGIVAVPMFIFAYGRPSEASGALLPLLIAADIFSVYHHWGTWDRRNVKILFPGSLLGIVLGSVFLWWLIYGGPGGDGAAAAASRQATERGLGVAIGIICVLYVVADQVKKRIAPNLHLRASMMSGSIAGTAAGFVSTLAHAAGPVLTIFLLGQHLSKQPFIGTAVIYFFTVNLIKLVPYAGLGLINTSTLMDGLWLVPLVPLGTYLGLRLNRWMSEQVFRMIILLIVLISGIELIIGRDAIMRMLGVG
jgi:hypothetical protein